MSLPEGYVGKVAIIDLGKRENRILSTEKFWTDYDIDPRLWLGGDGFITKILWKDFTEPINPLGLENEIIICGGPWTATAAPQAGRAMFGCISPETGGFSSGSFGWHFPAALKFAGYDILIIRGKSVSPVYIFIDDGEITFKAAAHIWGKETGETVKMIRQELGERYEGDIRVLSTSIAGENCVAYAPPCADGTSCPGRSGGGAVMGSKNLKAIAVRGTGEVPLHDPRGLLDVSYHAYKTFLEKEPAIKLWQEQGSTTSLSTVVGWPVTGTRLAENRKTADFPHLKNVACLNCMNPCYHWLQLKEGKHPGLRQLGGHMTFLTTTLRNLEVADFNEWIYYERLIQELGLDPASFSMNYSLAVECFEKGLLSPEETDGLTLKRGDPELIWDAARRVARREGRLGNLLAESQGEMAKRIGGEAEIIAYHIKGKPSLQRDSNLQALIWSLGFLTSPRGGDWLRLHNVWELSFLPPNRDTYPKYIGMSCVEMYQKSLELLDMPLELKKQIFGDPIKIDADWVRGTQGKALFSVWSENFVALFNSLVTCMFGAATQFLMVGFGPTTYAEILNKITGWNITNAELMVAGERVFNLQRLFNYRLKGWDYRNDRFADKRAYEPATIGLFKGKTVPWETTLQEYYAARGWSPEGIPTRSKVNQLKIDEVLKTVQLPE